MPIMTYKHFVTKLESKITCDERMYVDLFKKLSEAPTRYVGLFRVTNAKTKIIQC